MRDLVELFSLGGFVLPILILAAILALAIVGNRFWVLRRARVVPQGLVERVADMVEAGKLPQVVKQLYENDTPLARILLVALQQVGQPRDAIKEAVEDAGRHEMAHLDRYLNFLGSIAGVAPLLGLLGTVFGIMHAFAAIGAVGMGDPKALAGGIAEALITTAAGLIVAIPSLLFYRYFRGRVEVLVLATEKDVLKLVNLLAGGKS
ncbi:MotA/TolQ/ExbB proton channel family protein [Acidithiobacillus sp. CV18-2]|uniref:MotA/TolQ/ExbB proton channel family protein n=1 Tax=Igneacidithiobacillus copahuensis TaxID=2724909 RepID=A0AAE2YPQ7_9PROT|nr:MotA/TolQ/ExbB proton channel family protein [Acidithiobacillus sp. CV18-3]MBU2756632.1 MotA/TolQ/ExbB proton channel family protein [Acidithiobacillus sp. BN09-2]MBU2777649.1 MotA/TolQ/ExbB proton channel family protein [Acidithiobacillus sp. CV18-2]MBU2787975.1 MotA/TolQ/ExbB proton channel family protein [Igneacidithiobacillus copahuensis]MBU2796570.1 MotA/TolQ/ExbB proton channel family protein [Acidithiobacillus sp. VAN18-2]MBU2800644.1 MotA/TolQ/ExbB proton channel family protein [Aci